MLRRMIFPLLIGLLGGAILISLGVWQVNRLAWKEGVLADIADRLVAAPVALPNDPDPQRDRYLPVTVTGRFTGDQLDVLVSRKQIGAGVRVIEAFETDDGRRIRLVTQHQWSLPRSDVSSWAIAVRISSNSASRSRAA